jgi:hypothetical protein
VAKNTYLVTVIEKCQVTYIVSADSEAEAKSKILLDEFEDSVGSHEFLSMEEIVKVELNN